MKLKPKPWPLTWQDVDAACQVFRCDFDTQCRRMGLDPVEMRKQKRRYFV